VRGREGGEAEGNYWREKQTSLCLCVASARGRDEEEQSSDGDWSCQRLLRSCADQPVVPRHVSTRVEEVRW